MSVLCPVMSVFRLGTYFDYTVVVLRGNPFFVVEPNALIFNALIYKPAFFYMQANCLSC